MIIGLLVGLAGSVALGRIIQSMLFSARPYDPVTFGGSVLAIAARHADGHLVAGSTRHAVECTMALREE